MPASTLVRPPRRPCFRGVIQETDVSPKFLIDMPGRLLTLKDGQATPRTRVEIGEIEAGTSDWGVRLSDNAGTEIFRSWGAGFSDHILIRKLRVGPIAGNDYVGLLSTGAGEVRLDLVGSGVNRGSILGSAGVLQLDGPAAAANRAIIRLLDGQFDFRIGNNNRVQLFNTELRLTDVHASFNVLGADPAAVVDRALLYAKDVAASAELFVRDEAGNITQLSPHDPLTGEWYFHSHNARTGRTLRVNLERLLRRLVAEAGIDPDEFIMETRR